MEYYVNYVDKNGRYVGIELIGTLEDIVNQLLAIKGIKEVIEIVEPEKIETGY